METVLTIAAKQDLNILQSVYEQNKDDLNRPNSKGETPLIVAAKASLLDNVNFLISLPYIDLYSIDLITCTFDDYLVYKDISSLNKWNKLYNPFNRKFLTNRIPIFTTCHLSFEEKQRIIQDDLEYFQNNLSNFSDREIFIIACQYQAKKIIEYCIDNDFNLKYFTKHRITGLTYLMYFNMKELTLKYLKRIHFDRTIITTRDTLSQSPISYAGKEMRQIVRNIINPISYSSYEGWKNNLQSLYPDEDIEVMMMEVAHGESTSEFKIYHPDDFTYVDYLNQSKGVYGQVVHVIENSTGRDMMLKQFFEDKGRINPSNYKEIALLRKINSIDPHICPIIYGVLYIDDKFYMVMEKLMYTLDEIERLFQDCSPDEKLQYFKPIFRNILDNLDKLSSIGIVHNDLHLENIMMSSNGTFKIIDFGLADFYGLGPNKMILENRPSEHGKYIYPPDDSKKLKLRLPVENSNEKVDTEIQCSRSTINVDVFSLGCLMLNMIMNLHGTYFSYDGKLYFTMTRNETTYTYENENIRHFRKYRFTSYPGLNDLTTGMLNIVSTERFTAKRCLIDPFFTGVPIPSVDSVLYPFLPRVSREDFETYSYYTNDENIASSELVYLEEIHDTHLHDIMPSGKTKSLNYKIYAQRILELFRYYPSLRSFDLIISLLHKVKLLCEENSVFGDAVHISRYSSEYLCAIFSFMVSIFFYSHIRVEPESKITPRGQKFSHTELLKIEEKIMCIPQMYDFVVVESQVTYLITQFEIIRYSQIGKLNSYILNGLIRYAVEHDDMKMTVWEVICELTYKFIRSNNSMITGYFTGFNDKVRRILGQETRNIKFTSSNRVNDIPKILTEVKTFR